MTERESKWEDLTFDENGRLVDLAGPVEFVELRAPTADHLGSGHGPR